MPDLVFKIKTIADIEALKKTDASLRQVLGTMKAMGKDTTALESEIKRVETALNSEAVAAVRAADKLKTAISSSKAVGIKPAGLQQELANLQGQYGLPGLNPLSRGAGFLRSAAGKLPGASTFQEIFNGSTGTVAAVGVGLAAAGKGIHEFAGAQENATALDAALAQQQQLTKEYREQLQGLAGDLQNVTGVADDTWMRVLARLTQFGSTPKTIGMDMEAVKNLAGLLDGDVTQAAEAYSRALQGNYEIFSRYGIKVEEVGTQSEKLEALQKQLAERGGGQLEARNKTLIGQLQLLKNNLGDLFEAFGRWISQTGILQKVLYGMATSAEWLATKLGGVVPQVEGLENALAKSRPTLEEADRALKQYGQTMQDQLELSKAYQDSLNREIDAIVKKQRALDEITDAQMALKLAGVDAGEKAGRLTPTQAIQQRAAIRDAAENEKYLHALRSRTEAQQANEQRAKQVLADVADKQTEVSAAEQQVQKNKDIDSGRQKLLRDFRSKTRYWAGQQAALDAFHEGGITTGLKSLPIGDTGFSAGFDQQSQAWAQGLISKKLADLAAEEKAKLAEYDKTHAPEYTPGADETLKEKRKDFIERQKSATDEINKLTLQNQQLQDEINQLTTKQQITSPTARLQAATAVQEAQKKQIEEPLEKGSQVDARLTVAYQQLAAANNRLEALLKAQSKYVQTHDSVNEQLMVLITTGQSKLDDAIKRIEREQTRRNLSQP